MLSLSPNDLTRFHASYHKVGRHWIWNHPHNNGYGYIRIKNKKWRAHRLAYAAFVGDLLPGQDVHHKCKFEACVNPKCLKQLTKSEHFKEDRQGIHGENSKRKVCVNGHKLSGDNVYTRPSRPNFRECKKCKVEGTRRSRRRKRQELSRLALAVSES